MRRATPGRRPRGGARVDWGDAGAARVFMADTSMYDEAGAERSFEQLRAALERRLPV
ncbi:hypothetical protein GCM10027599_00760 [Yimella radicis]